MNSSFGYRIFISLNMRFMVRWKVAGELVSPKNITRGSNSPFRVLKAAFHSLPSLILMLLYPHHMSNLVKSEHPWSCSRIVLIRGSGYYCGLFVRLVSDSLGLVGVFHLSF